MNGTRRVFFALFLFSLCSISACDGGSDSGSSTGQQAVSAASSDVSDDVSVSDSVDESDSGTATENASNEGDHEEGTDYIWNNSAVTRIILGGDSVSITGEGATSSGGKVIITSAGTYDLSGTLTDGQIMVSTEDKGTVRLILDGVNVSCSKGSPLYVAGAGKAVIILADNKENIFSDAESYVFDNSETDEPNAAVFSADDLTIYGNGSLAVKGNYNDGIASKDGLIIRGGNISVSAKDDGIRGKDYLIVRSGTINIEAGGDGFKSDNDEDAGKGYVSVENGNMTIISGGDGIQAETYVMVSGGEIALLSGGGNGASGDGSTSSKGIKAVADVFIDGGLIIADSMDDAIHSNGNVTISGGSLSIATGDDGIHADSAVEIDGGDIDISKSYEGIEGSAITINNGNIRVASSDDGINGAGGNDSSGMVWGPGAISGKAAQDAFAYSGSYYLHVNGGHIFVDALGDGIDINGSIEMTDGVVLVSGPTSNANGALDYDGFFKITGGFLVAAGSSGMAQAPGSTSTQNSVLINMKSVQQASSLIHIRNGSSGEVLTYAPAKKYQSLVFSSPSLMTGSSYEVYLGGSSTGSVSDGLYQGGVYSPGSKYAGFTVSAVATVIK